MKRGMHPRRPPVRELSSNHGQTPGGAMNGEPAQLAAHLPSHAAR
jgi:hypothetical protein